MIKPVSCETITPKPYFHVELAYSYRELKTIFREVKKLAHDLGVYRGEYFQEVYCEHSGDLHYVKIIHSEGVKPLIDELERQWGVEIPRGMDIRIE